MISMSRKHSIFLVAAICVTLARASAEDKPVSYYNDVVPILKRSCTGCHHPGKMKGDLDLTTHESFKKGGKHGPAFKEGDPKTSNIIEEIGGKDPSMPKEGDPLSGAEVALIERWITEGAKDDTPADKRDPFKISAAPVYNSPSVISALAYSPDGELFAISGYHETLLYKSDGSELVARLLGDSPRVDSVAFSKDGKLLAVSGGAPALMGEVQIWDVQKHSLVRAMRLSSDSIYGVSFSPEGDRIACGGADKSVRLVNVADGKELFKFDNHSDWVFATTFTVDGKRVLSGSRDRAMKLISAANAQFIDDINKLLENVICFARHPKEDIVTYGGDQGSVRTYKMQENQGRTAANNDVNLVREYERQPAAVHAVCYSPDAALLAVGGASDEIRIYKTSDGSRAGTAKGFSGAIFALTAHPSKPLLAAGGFDGKVHIYTLPNGGETNSFMPFRIKNKAVAAR
jgi:WD40 repeat protein